MVILVKMPCLKKHDEQHTSPSIVRTIPPEVNPVVIA